MTTIAPSMAPVALKQLFDRQMAQAVKLFDCEDEIKRLFPLLEQVGTTERGEGRYPFIIVPRRPGLDLDNLMAGVVFNRQPGVNRISPGDRLANFCIIPSSPYLIVDVEDGLVASGIKPSDCATQFAEDYDPPRFGGTVIEGATVLIYYPLILRRHYIDLPGSSCRNGRIPCICLGDQGPELDTRPDSAAPRFGSLSCARRLCLGA